MLADEIAAVLPELQAEAEALMVDTCRATSPGEKVWDDDSGTYTPGPPVVVYEGRCQVPTTYPAAQDASAGETAWGKGFITVKVPARQLPGDVGDPLSIVDGHTITVTSVSPPMELAVRVVVPQTWEKSRKVSCERVTRDAG